jgi:hypothetical protein
MNRPDFGGLGCQAYATDGRAFSNGGKRLDFRMGREARPKARWLNPYPHVEKYREADAIVLKADAGWDSRLMTQSGQEPL